MSSPNGNLSLVERRDLVPGSVVAWQSDRMLKEQTGTVDDITGATLHLCDGAVVTGIDYCRLVSARPLPIICPDVRGVGDDRPAVPGVTAPAPSPVVDRAPADAQPPEGRRRGPRFSTLCQEERARRIDAVREVRALCEGGMPRTRAIALVAVRAGSWLTVRNYAHWLCMLRREGHIPPGRRSYPGRVLAPSPSAPARPRPAPPAEAAESGGSHLRILVLEALRDLLRAELAAGPAVDLVDLASSTSLLAHFARTTDRLLARARSAARAPGAM